MSVAGIAACTPALAFQFENGTIWPLAVAINNGPTQVVAPEEVAFLFTGQCNAGCTLSILLSDPSRPQSLISTAAGEPPAIGANGDRAIVRVRQERGGITVEVIADPAQITPPALPGTASTLPQQPLPDQPQFVPAQPPTLPQQPAAPQQTLPLAPAPTPPAQTPPAQTTTQAPDAPPVSGSSSPGFIPPPPAPDYDAN